MPGATPPSSSFGSSNRAGYTGSYRRVTAYVSRIRQAQGIPPRRQGRRQTLPRRGGACVPALDAAPGDLAGAAA